MKDEVLVKVENVSKKFCRDLKRSLWYGVKDISSELFGAKKNGQLRPKEFWAVDDVSFELRRGECLGLIGHNGAGKSTLLKMLNGLIKPDKGRITMKGRIGALIELGAGFNPILTGRENIYNNGAVLGFSKKEIDAKFDAIVDFAEIGDFLDTPVQNYSSGMKVRLGFAVAAQMEPDVLIIDEVLAVGDVGFRIKSYNAINELSKKACVILVSHSMPQVARVADHILLMNKGQTFFQGNNVAEGIEKYFGFFGNNDITLFGDGIDLKTFKISSNGEQTNTESENNNIKYLQEIHFNIDFHVKKTADKVIVDLVFFDLDLKPIASCTSGYIDASEKENNVKLIIGKNLFSPGTYSININFLSYDINSGKTEILGKYENISKIKSYGSKLINHVSFQLEGEWSLNKKQL